MKGVAITGRVQAWTTVALLSLAAGSLILSELPLGGWEMSVAMIIAGIKAALVLLFFMRLLEQSVPSILVVTVAVAFVLILAGGTVLDVGTRFGRAEAPPVSRRPPIPLPMPSIQPGPGEGPRAGGRPGER